MDSFILKSLMISCFVQMFNAYVLSGTSYFSVDCRKPFSDWKRGTIRDKEKTMDSIIAFAVFSRDAPIATIIFEFLSCASAQGEDSKEKKG